MARGGFEAPFPGGSQPPFGEEIPRQGPRGLSISQLSGDLIEPDVGGGFLG